MVLVVVRQSATQK
jgi:hypothetical protein